jgi:hypothetical protein
MKPGLMEDICSDANMNRALKQVKRNQGAAGVDGITIDDLLTFWSENSQDILRDRILPSKRDSRGYNPKTWRRCKTVSYPQSC